MNSTNVSKKILVSGILVEDVTSEVGYSIVSTGENYLTTIHNADLLRWLEAEYGTKFNTVMEWAGSTTIWASLTGTLATFLEDRLNGEAYFQQLRHLAIAEDFKHFAL